MKRNPLAAAILQALGPWPRSLVSQQFINGDLRIMAYYPYGRFWE